MKVIVLKNPDLQTILAKLRNVGTETNEFRRYLRYAGYLMTHEILSRECSSKSFSVKTPLGNSSGVKIQEKIIPVIVMRAGEPFGDSGIKLLDELDYKREIGVVDAKRIEMPDFVFEIDISSFKVPKFSKEDIVIIYDPLLATASTLLKILKKMKSNGKAKKLIICSVISSTYGINQIKKNFPNSIVYTLGIDKKLNNKGYIVPGLGDCGDRAFGKY